MMSNICSSGGCSFLISDSPSESGDDGGRDGWRGRKEGMELNDESYYEQCVGLMGLRGCKYRRRTLFPRDKLSPYSRLNPQPRKLVLTNYSVMYLHYVACDPEPWI